MKRPWSNWDVRIGLVLALCGLVLALWDRQREAPPGSAATRHAATTPAR